MAGQYNFKRIAKLIFVGVLAGFSTGLLELYIGHRFILDKLLLGKDLNFIYESFFFPTYYGLAKSIVVALTFFLVYLLMPKIRIKPLLTGILGTSIFGIYYYFTFPHASFYSSFIIGIVHFSFIAGITYIFAKISKL